MAEHMDVVDNHEKRYKNSLTQESGRTRSSMAPKRKRTSTRRRKPAKRQRQMAYSQVGGVSLGLIVGIGKAGYGITKALGDYQTKRAIKTAEKRRREVEQGKRKRYAGELFYCPIM